MTEEIWKPVVGYEDRFLISSFGNLKSAGSGKILSQCESKSGYMLHATKIGGRNGKAVCFKIHRLVAEAFLSVPSDELKVAAGYTFYKKVSVNHKDGIKTNNKTENLEWCSYSENTRHAYDTGLIDIKTGSDHPLSKLSESDVEDIKNSYIKGSRTFGSRALGEKYGVDHMQILRAMKRDNSVVVELVDTPYC